MKLGFAPDYIATTVASLKSNLYNYLLPKAQIQIGFWIDGTLSRITQGVVETFQNSAFSADPEVDVSIICFDPDFYETAPESVSGSTVSSTTTQTVSYAGTSDAGVILTLDVNATMSGFTIYNTRPDSQVQEFDVTASLLSGDVVIVTSIAGFKSIILDRSGLKTSLLYAVDPTSDWISLMKGSNLFRVHSSVTSVPYVLEYTAKYGAL